MCDHVDPRENDPDEELINELMSDHTLDKDEAEEALEIMDEYGFDEDQAIELIGEL